MIVAVQIPPVLHQVIGNFRGEKLGKGRDSLPLSLLQAEYHLDMASQVLVQQIITELRFLMLILTDSRVLTLQDAMFLFSAYLITG